MKPVSHVLRALFHRDANRHVRPGRLLSTPVPSPHLYLAFARASKARVLVRPRYGRLREEGQQERRVRRRGRPRCRTGEREQRPGAGEQQLLQ